jgi:hypothetical protein
VPRASPVSRETVLVAGEAQSKRCRPVAEARRVSFSDGLIWRQRVGTRQRPNPVGSGHGLGNGPTLPSHRLMKV